MNRSAGVQRDRHLAAAGPDRPVAHGVNTAVKEDEGAGRQHVLDRTAGQAHPQQLPPSHHSVLRARDRRRNPKWGPLSCYGGVNGLHPTILPPPASPNNAQSQRNGPETPTSLPSRS